MRKSLMRNLTKLLKILLSRVKGRDMPMNELETLQQQKVDLLAKIQQIAENREGIENPENVAKVTELNAKQSELLAQKGKLQTNLSALDNELGNIAKNIRDLSGSGIERILQAIKKQRWYFFKNKPKVLMDRDTGLLWNNLNFSIENERRRGNWYSVNEANTLIQNLSLNDFKNWKVTNKSYFEMLTNSTANFPFYFREKRIVHSYNPEQNSNVKYTTVLMSENNNNTIKARWCDHDYPKENGSEGLLLIYSEDVVSSEYSANISPSNNFYSETEKLQFTLDIFVQNDLIPLFDDAEITNLYRQIYVEKPALMKQLAELDEKIAELQKNEVRLTANFNYKPLLAKYDVKAVESSVIQYYGAVLSVTDEIMDILQEYETEQNTTISEFSNIALKLGAKYTSSSHLSDDENNVLKERQKIISERMELNIDDAKRQILLFKKQAENLADEVNQITHGENSITLLAELEQKPRMSFPFLVENLARVVRGTQQKVDFFTLHRDFVTNIVNLLVEWNDNYKSFKTNKHEELINVCRDNGIDEEVFKAWYEDWQKKRFAVEQRFLPLVNFALNGNLLSEDDSTAPAECVLEILKGYKEQVDNFYLNERKNIYQKFAFQAGGDLQEKFETESELYKLTEKLQSNLSEIIFSRDKTEERLCLLDWTKPLLNLPIDEIIDFVADKELSTISAEVLGQFSELKRRNLATYIADSQAYAEALKLRESEYNALMFKMRKDLQQQ